ncbi:hypothetical protein GCM10017783_09900 [Deinococcus piscis]|uniref:Uncharacterized protein n=1 Tax=Deinococcus piscis TaxID=394230 RepID=A0ABQ3K400_9DEIO|nr:hypothetical protein [Deinococcus piscis]GHF99802.1 hypothetical protein GCM10017783_09900 [Deinococcus piscis]
MRHLLVTLALAALTTAAAAGQIPGQPIYYFPKRDVMTDANQGSLAIAEANDTGANTFVGVFCNGQGGYDIILNTKNPLMTENSFYLNRSPNVMYRIDSEAPKTVKTETAFLDDAPDLTAVWFTEQAEKEIYRAFVRGRSKVTMRVMRDGMAPLDYVFTAKGFIAAMERIGNCR